MDAKFAPHSSKVSRSLLGGNGRSSCFHFLRLARAQGISRVPQRQGIITGISSTRYFSCPRASPAVPIRPNGQILSNQTPSALFPGCFVGPPTPLLGLVRDPATLHPGRPGRAWSHVVSDPTPSRLPSGTLLYCGRRSGLNREWRGNRQAVGLVWGAQQMEPEPLLS